MDYKSIGKRIKERRKELGLSQEDLAEILRCKKQNISEYELGKRKGLNLKKLEQIAQALNIDISYLLGYENTEDTEVPQPLIDFLTDKELLYRLDVKQEEIEFLKSIRFRPNQKPNKQTYIDMLMIYRNLE